MVFGVSKGVVCAFNMQQPVCVGGITMVRAARVYKKNTLQPLHVPPVFLKEPLPPCLIHDNTHFAGRNPC